MCLTIVINESLLVRVQCLLRVCRGCCGLRAGLQSQTAGMCAVAVDRPWVLRVSPLRAKMPHRNLPGAMRPSTYWIDK